jgi:hypothetical protein
MTRGDPSWEVMPVASPELRRHFSLISVHLSCWAGLA